MINSGVLSILNEINKTPNYRMTKYIFSDGGVFEQAFGLVFLIKFDFHLIHLKRKYEEIESRLQCVSLIIVVIICTKILLIRDELPSHELVKRKVAIHDMVLNITELNFTSDSFEQHIIGTSLLNQTQ